MTRTTDTAWRHGRLDARPGPSRLLFGRMYEDARIEDEAFRPGSRVFCIASAGDTALALSAKREVVAVDINPAQLVYAERRAAGAPARRGRVERLLAAARFLAPLAGWRRPVLREFLELSDTKEQAAFWKERLDTRRLRFGLDVLLSPLTLGRVYAPALLDALPDPFGPALRSRLERGIGRHPNRDNPYLKGLLLGELPPRPAGALNFPVHFFRSDAAAFLEDQEPRTFDGFTLSNISDGASKVYARRLEDAVRRAAKPGAVVVRRSFSEPRPGRPAGRAADDRSMLWGIVDVRHVEAL